MARSPLTRTITLPVSRKAEIPVGSIIEVQGAPRETDRRWIVLNVTWQQVGAMWTASVEIRPYIAHSAN
jgi:hypothetical protein